jgi:uncharacterized membrane protein YgdD (TMEM256/DUF423 family)
MPVSVFSLRLCASVSKMMPLSRTFTLLAAICGFLGVALGAFGAHALSSTFEARPADRATYDTATQYLQVHALALLGAAWLVDKHPQRRTVRAAGWLFFAGTILFCGSLYILSVFDVRWMGAVAPLGGAAFLAGWTCVAWTALRG